jgi:hypothetical protein
MKYPFQSSLTQKWMRLTEQNIKFDELTLSSLSSGKDNSPFQYYLLIFNPDLYV